MGYPTAPPPPQKSNTGLWVSIAVVVVLLIGAGAVVTFLMLNKDKGNASANGTPSATATQTVDPVVAERQAHVSTPAQIGNLRLSTDSDKVQNANQVRDSFRAEIPAAKDIVGAYYDDPTDSTKNVLVVAATANIDDPDGQITRIFDDPTATITNVHTVDPGALSGSAKCADAATAGSTAIVCVWADHGSVGVIFSSGRTESAAEDVFRQIRGGMLSRG
jgi:hypothetical protein